MQLEFLKQRMAFILNINMNLIVILLKATNVASTELTRDRVGTCIGFDDAIMTRDIPEALFGNFLRIQFAGHSRK